MKQHSSFRDRCVDLAERYLPAIIFGAGILVLAVVFRESDQREINAYLGRTSGTFIRVQTSGKGGPWACFEYTVNGHQYEAFSSSGKQPQECMPMRTCLGKKFMIEYSTRNPEKSRVNWTMPVE
ncbi:MAG: hypothetical protein KF797_09535 [Flavobacteriales bacterium]|nr:hypothetical protein [Flavobacteriales bacterium]